MLYLLSSWTFLIHGPYSLLGTSWQSIP